VGDLVSTTAHSLEGQPRLSARHREILALLAAGVQARAIAELLGISEATVRNHIRVILRRLDCHSQLEAVARARQWRLV
jgi:DNA-binding NarL/FixJ family response regulator